MATTTAADRSSARERLLAAANELFYEEGVHTVGIDRVIDRAGVAKATLYKAFGSKDELIRAYLETRHTARRTRITERVEEHREPRERLLAVFDALADSLSAPGYNGCAFANASAEAQPGGPIGEAVDEHRGWFRTLLVDLSRAAGATEPEQLARTLVLLYDGAGISARLDGDRSAAAAARAAAAALIDQATTGAAAVGDAAAVGV